MLNPIEKLKVAILHVKTDWSRWSSITVPRSPKILFMYKGTT